MQEKTLFPSDNELFHQVGWVIRLRWIAVGSVFLFAALTRISSSYNFFPVLVTAIFVSAYNYIAWKYHSYLENAPFNQKATQLNLQIQIALDILVITWAVHLTGGAESQFTAFYFVHIPLLGLAISRQTLINYVILISLLLALLFGFEYYDILPHGNLDTVELMAAQSSYKNYNYVIRTWSLTVLFLSLGAYIINYLRENFQILLKTKEWALLESDILKDVAFSLSTTLKWEETVSVILDSVNQVATFDIAIILFVNGRRAKIIAGREIPAEFYNTLIPVQKGSFLDGKKCLINITHKDSKAFWGIFKRKNIQSTLCIPMTIHGAHLGVLAIGSETPNLYQPKDITLIRSLGNYAAISLSNSQLYENTREQALKDGLTGLNNRRALQSNLQKEGSRAKRYGQCFSLLMCDLDNFKNYNDRYGHLAGDDLLRDISSLMLHTLRLEDQVFRYGGEEFTILLPKTEKEQAFILAERLRKTIEKYEFILQDSGKISHITISIGLSTFPDDVNDTEDLLQSADEALYQAKEKRNSVIEYAKRNSQKNKE